MLTEETRAATQPGVDADLAHREPEAGLAVGGGSIFKNIKSRPNVLCLRELLMKTSHTLCAWARGNDLATLG